MIVTVGNTKGGVGKTTLAFLLAMARAGAARDVLLVDGDLQATAQTAVTIRSESARLPCPACVWFPDHRVLGPQVRRQATKYQDVILDVGGRDTQTLRTALMLSDTVVVPFQPRSAEVWALADMASVISETMAQRDGLRVLAVLNGADPTDTSDNRDALAALGDHQVFPMATTPVRRRKAFANALGLGLALDELVPQDPKACAELSALVRIVFDNADAIMRM
jgi:chromosome partitioning protein